MLQTACHIGVNDVGIHMINSQSRVSMTGVNDVGLHMINSQSRVSMMGVI